MIAPEQIPAFIVNMTECRDAALSRAKAIRNELIKFAHPQEGDRNRSSTDRLSNLIEDIAIAETAAATYGIFIPEGPGVVLHPERLESRFVTASLAQADATWSGTGNGLRLVKHKAKIDTLQEIRPILFP